MPYVLLGGQSFFDRREIRDMLAYLKVMAQPQDEISLLSIINVPARGIGTSTTEKLLKRAVQERMSLWDAIPLAVEAGEVPAKAAHIDGRHSRLRLGIVTHPAFYSRNAARKNPGRRPILRAKAENLCAQAPHEMLRVQKLSSDRPRGPRKP